jgi:hypothetical protein
MEETKQSAAPELPTLKDFHRLEDKVGDLYNALKYIRRDIPSTSSIAMGVAFGIFLFWILLALLMLLVTVVIPASAMFAAAAAAGEKAKSTVNAPAEPRPGTITNPAEEWAGYAAPQAPYPGGSTPAAKAPRDSGDEPADRPANTPESAPH